MKKIIATNTATTVKELLEVLASWNRLFAPDGTYITINSDAVRLELIEETLTDGSKVYNVELSEVTKCSSLMDSFAGDSIAQNTLDGETMIPGRNE